MPLGRHQNTEFRWGLHIKLKSLGFQGLAGIIYLNIFYLKCFWEGMKTPSFAHTIGKSALPGVGRNNIYLKFFLKYLWESMETPSFASKIEESRLSGVCRNNIICVSSTWNALGRASKHPIWWGLHITLKTLGFQEWAGIIYLNIFYLKWFLARHENTKFCTYNWQICTGRDGQE